MNSTTTSDRPSGRFVLRIPPDLHESLRQEAADAGLSLNSYCTRALASPTAALGGPVPEIVAQAMLQFGSDLIGVLAFGSWARGEMTPESDVDILIVVQPGVPIVRNLYRTWDERPMEWEGAIVQVHIVQPPAPGELPSAFWAEAAMEGVVLFERSFDLSRRLVQIRRHIVDGHVYRREIDGHAYWVAER